MKKLSRGFRTLLAVWALVGAGALGIIGANLGGVRHASAQSQVTPAASATDPCLTAAKSSILVSITSATTTALVTPSGSKSVYVCGGALTIAPSATTADTAVLESGTGAACASSITTFTGQMGAGDLTTAAPPIVVPLGSGGTSMTGPSGTGLCILSAGTTVNIQGWVYYVQQ